MTRGDDPPATPFAGDGSGKIFDAPDMVWATSAAPERVVDTQSGFLVVIRKQGDTQSLLVKRRLGTPPSSTVTLTPDEGIKLARILLGNANEQTVAQAFAPEAQEVLADLENQQAGTSSMAASADYTRRQRRRAFKRRLQGATLTSCITVLLVCALVGYSLDNIKSLVTSFTPAAVVKTK